MLRFRVASLVSLGLLACSSHPPAATEPAYASGAPWPKFRANAAQTGTASICPKAATGLTPWSFPTGHGVFSSPVVAADGTIYVGSADRNFYALNPDGTSRWTVTTGEIIDSSGLLDDQGNVYFGSGDGILRAVNAKTGAPVWQFQADSPAVNRAYINWFEGNVALGANGELIVPNDNWFLYGIDRASGAAAWRYNMPDQTWSLPAVSMPGGDLFVGNNNLLAILGDNTFSLTPNGVTLWRKSSLGTVAASPLITADGKMFVGGFDGYLHAYDQATGNLLWESPTRDHIYSSPALLPNGNIVQPSADGSLYAFDPSTGAIAWEFDTPEPIRSSPAVDCEGNVYVGTGDGKLLVLTKDGAFLWSMQLISADRENLNASPALGTNAIYIGGESGEVFGVPYNWCLLPAAAGDTRCSTTPPEAPADGASLILTSPFGQREIPAPSAIDATMPLVFSLVVESGGRQILATLDPSTVAVSATPTQDVAYEVSGDGKFVTVSPTPSFAPGSDGTVSLTVSATYLTNLTRKGLALSGGTATGTATATASFTVNGGDTTVLEPSDAWILTRLSIPLPTIMPSYNQIGFDQLVYVLSFPEIDGGAGIGWMVGGLENADGGYSVDPNTQAIVPLTTSIAGGLVSAANEDGLTVNVMNLDVPFTTFAVSSRFTDDAGAIGTAVLRGSATCADVPMYGEFMEDLGMCNPETDIIDFYGASNVLPYAPPPVTETIGTPTFSATDAGATVTLVGSTLTTTDHLTALLLIDPVAGVPISLNYGTDTTRGTNPDGTLASITVPFGTVAVPSTMTALVMVDTSAVATGTVTASP